MNRPLIAERNDRALTASYSVQLAGSFAESQTGAERIEEDSGSAFLLDWLARGEGCKRDIRGFSVKPELLLRGESGG